MMINNRGEGYINTGVKIIISVVIGALILGGIYLLFAGNGGIVDRTNEEIRELMHYNESPTNIGVLNESNLAKDLAFTYDGREWYKANIPEYQENATIDRTASHGSVCVAIVRDAQNVYLISSADGGINWEQRVSWSASEAKYTSVQWSEQNQKWQASYSNSFYCQLYKSNDGVKWEKDGSPWVFN